MRYREIPGDIGSDREISGDIGRCREIWGLEARSTLASEAYAGPALSGTIGKAPGGGLRVRCGCGCG